MGKPQTSSFANRIRTAVKELTAQGRECTAAAISIQALLTERKDNKRMLNALRDMTRAGELARVSPGVYAATRQGSPREPPQELRQIMWRLLRMRRLVTVEDLMEMSGAGRDYAAEWLRTLARHQVVRAEGDAFRLLRDTVEMPELTDNADKLRAIRVRKKQAICDMLDLVNQTTARVRAAIETL